MDPAERTVPGLRPKDILRWRNPFKMVAVSVSAMAFALACAHEPSGSHVSVISVAVPSAALPVSSAHEESPAPTPAREDLVLILPVRVYQGRIYRSPPILSKSGQPPGQLVIRDQRQYNKFLARIPRRVITMKSPAPPSRDPLVKRPVVDFDKRMVLVAERPGMYEGVLIERVEKKPDGTVLVSVVHRVNPRARVMASRLDIGTYAAMVVPRVNGRVVWKVRRIQDTPIE